MCTPMGSGPLSHPDVLALAEKFITVKVDTDRPENRPLIFSGRFRVDDLPALAFYTSRGSFIAQLPANERGSGAAVARRMREALAEHKLIDAQEDQLRKAVAEATGELAPRDALASFLVARRRMGDAIGQLELAFELARSNGVAGADVRLSEVIKLHLKQQQLVLAEAQINRFRALFPGSARRPRVEYYRALRHRYGSPGGEPTPAQLERAAHVLRELVNDFPGSRYAYRGGKLLDRLERMVDDAKRYPEAFRD